jgi:hypothetical protein
VVIQQKRKAAAARDRAWRQPAIATILAFLGQKDFFGAFVTKTGHKTGFAIGDALFRSSGAFGAAPRGRYNRTVFLNSGSLSAFYPGLPAMLEAACAQAVTCCMNRIAVFGCAAAALFCAACSSLPDGSKKPQLTADRVAVADQNGLRGFNVRFTLHHNSLEPLEIKKIAAKVGVNRTLMCSAEIEEDDTPVAPRRDVTLTRFFPANLARPVSLKTLSSPMLHAEGEVQLQVFFTGDDEDPFNPSATYKGMIENDSQQ